MRHLCIFLIIRRMSLIVLVCILKHTDQNDKGEWQSHERLAIRYRYASDCLHISDQQKVQILRLAELRVQVHRQEGNDIVL